MSQINKSNDFKKRKYQLKLTHRTIIFWLSLAAFIHNVVMNGAMNVIISSLQKEFYLSSKDTGIYISVYDIGSLLSSLIIPILGSHGSKPRWIAFGMLMLSIGCFVNVLPHFIRPKSNNYNFNDTDLSHVSNDIELCYKNDNLTEFDFDECTSQANITKSTHVSGFRFDNLKYVLYASNIINGLSSASMTTLAFSYIEDIAPVKLSAVYDSVYYATGALGMGIGFMITSRFLNIHNDIDNMSRVPKWMTPNHPNWIGAWWLPFLIFGTVAFILSMLLCIFPETASNNVENKSETTHTTPNQTPDGLSLQENNKSESEHLNSNNNNYDEYDDGQMSKSLSRDNNYETDNTLLSAVKTAGSIISLNHSVSGLATIKKPNTTHNIVKPTKSSEKLKRILKLSYKLLRNPLFSLILIASAIEGLLQNSFLAFASLFLEYQYRIASGTASFILGALSIPPLILGSLLSGFLIKKFNWKQRSCLTFLTVVLFFNMILYSGFLLYCKEPNILLNTTDHRSKLNAASDLRTNITSIKNMNCFQETDSNCKCNENLFKPVCLINGEDEYVFQTACIAGCQSYNYDTNVYSNCTYAECMLSDSKSHISSNSTTTSQFSLSNGLCPSPSICQNKLIISYATIFFVMFFTALVFVPYIKVTIGCTNSPEMNPIALGIKQLAMTGIGTVPGPIIFGTFIDTTCKYWYTDCLNQKVCKVYSNRKFSLIFGTLGIFFKAICWVSVFIGCLYLRFKKKKGTNSDDECNQGNGNGYANNNKNNKS